MTTVTLTPERAGAMRDALDDLERPLERPVRAQLSLDVGGGPPPKTATLKITGALAPARELPKGEPVRVTVTAVATGEVVAEGEARVVQLAFKDHPETKSRAAYTERAHTLGLGR